MTTCSPYNKIMDNSILIAFICMGRYIRKQSCTFQGDDNVAVSKGYLFFFLHSMSDFVFDPGSATSDIDFIIVLQSHLKKNVMQ